MSESWNYSSHLKAYDLSGKVGIVTGAGQGIGEASAHALADAGAKVVLVGRSAEKLHKVSQEISSKTEVLVLQANLDQEEQISKVCLAALSKFKRIDILVNNAGIGQWKDTLELDLANWNQMLKTNLTSTFLFSREAGKIMKNEKYGKIVNISSISGTIINALHNHAHYEVSKAGVIHLTHALAAEWAKLGIRVNCISPGYTETKMLGDLLDTERGVGLRNKIQDLTPVGKLAEVTDISQAVLFLSVPASDYITGVNLVIDGGYTLW
jgi:sorbose reductase